MKAIIDRFEGDYAVIELEDREMIDRQKTLIPVEAKEGDSLEIVISLDKDETERRKKRIDKLTEGLWEQKKGLFFKNKPFF